MCAIHPEEVALWGLDVEPGFVHGRTRESCAEHLGAALTSLRDEEPRAYIQLSPAPRGVCLIDADTIGVDDSLLGGGRGSLRDRFAELYEAAVALADANPAPVTSGLAAALVPLRAEIEPFGSAAAALRPRRSMELAFQATLRSYRGGPAPDDEQAALADARRRLVSPFKELHHVAWHLLKVAEVTTGPGYMRLAKAVGALQGCTDWGLVQLPGVTALPPSLAHLRAE